jgi:hypothetical protein
MKIDVHPIEKGSTTMKSYACSSALLPLLANSVGEARAGLLTSSSQITGSPIAVDFSQFNQPFMPVGTTGISLGNGVTLTSDDPNAVIGNDFYALGSNGQQSPVGRNGFVALNDLSGDLIFTFSRTISQVGAFLNYDPDLSPPDATISALSSTGSVLATYDLNTLAPISTPGQVNAKAFRGIGLSSSGIAAFEVSNSAIVVDELVFSTSPFASVPEPASATLLSIGLLGLLGYNQRRRLRPKA